MGNEIVEIRNVDGFEVVIYGCWDKETPENKYDFYDIDVNGDCINIGEPCYTKSTDNDIRAFLEIQEELKK